MAILIKKLAPPVLDFVLGKQLEYRREKGHLVSLESTIERLLKEAYLQPETKKK